MTTPSPFETAKGIGDTAAVYSQERKENVAIENILNQVLQSDDPNVVNNFIGQILTNVSPEKRPAVMQAIQQHKQQSQEQRSQQEYTKVADTIEVNNPNSASHKILATVLRSDMSTDQKEKIGKLIQDTNPFKIEQSQRLANDSIIKNYNSLIKELNEDKKNMTGSNRLERKKKIDKRIEYLKNQRDRLFKFNSNLPNEEKQSFDPNNPEHVNEAKALQSQGKTKAEIKKILEEKYEF